ncbi:hypothetical protein EDD86DRAFT_92787 [Gorgonomyces haynaldii]|nr:hypothetical protein EDD86DRAFT_92787 [Gorgonomyces haynaldii]
MYVAEYGGNRIRKITPGGTVSAFVGNCVATNVDGSRDSTSIKAPTGIAFDSAGVMYVSVADSHCIKKVMTARVMSTYVGQCGVATDTDGQGTAATLTGPFGLKFDSEDSLWVASYGSARIRKISTTGFVSTISGQAGQGFADGFNNVAQYAGPVSIVFDTDNTIYISDSVNHRIRKFIRYWVCVVGSFTTVGTCNGYITATYPVAVL